MTTTRRLAAILAADVAGYSAAMERDEDGTAAAVRALRREVIEPKLAEHQGRLIKTTGDGFLAEFASPIAALKCALAIQQRPAESSGLRLRIGLNLGDVIIEEGGDVLGEGVNIAARLEGLAEPGGILISSKIYSEVEGKVQAAFEDCGDQQVKNISKPVRAYAVRAGAAAGAQTSPLQDFGKQLPLPDKPSIAVLPFQNMSGDPEQEYFADGMVEDIITALSRFKSLFVIARNSSFTYKGKAVDIKQVGRELGVRYVLEGSVRKAGGRVRITGQLIEAETGSHLWADKFDGALEDVFELQDRVTSSVVGAIAPRLDQAEIERARRKPVENLVAYDFFLKGMAQVHTSNREALRLFSRAIELDPEFATPYGMAARCYSFRGSLGRATDRELEIAETRRLAQRVAAIGQDDALALTWAGLALAELCREYELGAALADQAVAVNPNMAVCWVNRGAISMYMGQHETAVHEIMRGMRLSPIDLETYRAEFVLACAYLCQDRFDDGLHWAQKSFAHRPGMSNLILIVANVLSGQVEEARRLAVETRQLLPSLSVSMLRRNIALRRPVDLNLYCASMRLAGLPE